MTCMRIVLAFKNLFRIELSENNKALVYAGLFLIFWTMFVILMVAFFDFVK